MKLIAGGPISSQAVDLPFLDVEFRYVNLQEWLKHRQYAVLFTGCTILVTRSIGEGCLSWKITRFDFGNGVIGLARGGSMEDLNRHSKYLDEEKMVIGVNSKVNPMKENNTVLHQLSYPAYDALCWKTWGETLMQRDESLIEAVSTTLSSVTTFSPAWKANSSPRYDVLYKSSVTSTRQYTDLRSRFCKSNAALIRTGPPSTDLGTTFRESKGNRALTARRNLSSKERCALLDMQSDICAVRLHGLPVLLDLLLETGIARSSQKGVQHSARCQVRVHPLTGLSHGIIHPYAVPHLEVHAMEEENISLSSGLMGAMGMPPMMRTSKLVRAIDVGCQTERALIPADINMSQFGEMESDRSLGIPQQRGCSILLELRLCWQRVLEWVDSDFLENNFKKGVTNKSIKKVRDPVANIDVQKSAEACLRVIKIAPGEGSYRIIKGFVLLLRKAAEVVVALKTGSPQINSPGYSMLVMRGIREKLRASLDEMVSVCNLLTFVLSSSATIASGLANMDGLILILDLYSILVKDFSFTKHQVVTSRVNLSADHALPGVALGIGDNPLNVLRPLAASRFIGDRKECPKFVPGEVSTASRVTHSISGVKEIRQDCQPLSLRVEVGAGASSIKVQRLHIPQFLTCSTAYPFEVHSKHETHEKYFSFHSDTCPSITLFETMSKLKFLLLQSLAYMLGSPSVALNAQKSILAQKLESDDSLSWFVSDLIASPADAESKKVSLLLIFLLGNILEKEDGRQKWRSRCKYVKGGPWWNDLGPPPITALPTTSFSDIILRELRAGMVHALERLTWKDGCEMFELGMLVEGHAKAYISSLWICMADLLNFLSDYIQHWPENCHTPYNVLRYCGTQINQTLTLLASLGTPVTWGPAQILAMQRILEIFGVCIRVAVTDQNTEVKSFTRDTQIALRDMIVGDSIHWDCIQSYVSWLILDMCQGCLSKLLQEFQQSLQVPVQFYYSSLGEHIGMRGIPETTVAITPHLEILSTKALVFIRLVVMLVQRSLRVSRDGPEDSNAHVFWENSSLTFLQGLMNPSNGLLMMVIKGGFHVHIKEKISLAPDPLPTRWNNPQDNHFSTSRRKRGVELCDDFARAVTELSHASKLSLSAEQESLLLLAEIFSLKGLHPDRRREENINPFLSSKYLAPFLGVIYSRFVALYTSITQSFCLCSLFAKSMLVVAQNLTEHARKIFRRLCVMKFLVKQIALEYEFPQFLGLQSSIDRGSTLESKKMDSTRGNIESTCLRRAQYLLRGVGGCSSPTSGSLGLLISGFRHQDIKLQIIAEGSESGEAKRRQSTAKYKRELIDRSLTSGCGEFILRGSFKGTTNFVRKATLPFEGFKKESWSHISKRGRVASMSREVYPSPEGIALTITADLYSPGLEEDFGALPTILLHAAEDCDALRIVLSEHKVGAVYSGRYFDLNEEVEPELAVEEDECTKDDRIGVCNPVGQKLKDLGNRTNVFYETGTGSSTPTAERQIQNWEESSNTVNIYTSRSSRRISARSPKLWPLVPKLNLTKATHKHHPDATTSCGKKILSNDIAGHCLCWESADNGRDSCFAYEERRLRRRIYHNENLHMLLLELFMYLMLNPE